MIYKGCCHAPVSTSDGRKLCRLEEAAKATLETRLHEREKLYKVRATRASVSPPPPAGMPSNEALPKY